MPDKALDQFDAPLTIAVIGASGGIGSAFVKLLSDQENVTQLHVFSRSKISLDHEKITSHGINITDEGSIQNAVQNLGDIKFDIIILASGMLHDETTMPEKSLRDINIDNFNKIFLVNTFAPALVAKYFLPLLPKDKKSVFTALSARVGSISDNGLGGWYAYRASKAALNMILKNAAIETARRYKQASIIGLHPGTVDTGLSKPFQGNVAEGKLFTADQSAAYMLNVINNVTPEDSGHTFAWDGQKIPF